MDFQLNSLLRFLTIQVHKVSVVLIVVRDSIPSEKLDEMRNLALFHNFTVFLVLQDWQFKKMNMNVEEAPIDPTPWRGRISSDLGKQKFLLSDTLYHQKNWMKCEIQHCFTILPTVDLADRENHHFWLQREAKYYVILPTMA